MINTLISAQSYISHLDKIDENWNTDKSTVASALVSYAAKVNKIDLVMFAKEFRKWQRQWDMFERRELKIKPKNIDEFINEIK